MYFDFNTDGSSGWGINLSPSGSRTVDRRQLAIYATTTTFTYNGNTIWTSGNDGAGSGLDAGLLMGYTWTAGQNVSFGTVSTTSVVSTGVVTSVTPNSGTTGGFRLTANATSGFAYSQVLASDGSTQWGYWSHSVAGEANWNGVGGLKHNGNTVWDSTNDGAGSGLDADTVDGYHASDLLKVLPGLSTNLKIDSRGVSNYLSVITADNAVLGNSAGLITVVTGVNVTLDISTTGIGGLSTGVLAANTWYYIYLAYNPTTSTIGGFFDPSSTAPTPPAGYTYYARQGSVLTDSSGGKYLYPTLKAGGMTQYVPTTGSNLLGIPQVALGVTSGLSALGIALFVPPTAKIIHVVLSCSSSGTGAYVAPNSTYTSYSTNTNPSPIAMGGSGYITGGTTYGSFVLESSYIYYSSGESDNSVHVFGWE
jgi:hypothetical protein